MRIAVIGTGGVGGYFGGMLAYAGKDVTFVARGSHLASIQANGLQVNSVHGDFHVFPAAAASDMVSVGTVDLVLVCVKDFQLEHAIPKMESLVGKDTIILPLLNGIRAAENLSDAFGRSRVLGGLCSVIAYIEAPGIIKQESEFRRVSFGEWDGQVSPRAQAIYDTFIESGIDAELSTDIRKSMWTKFLFITSFSGVASVVRLPAGGLHAAPETMQMLREAMEEIHAVAVAKGVKLDADIVERTFNFVAGMSPQLTSSMQRDAQAGNVFELEAMTGWLVRAGEDAGIATPVNRFIYAALKPQLTAAQQAEL